MDGKLEGSIVENFIHWIIFIIYWNLAHFPRKKKSKNARKCFLFAENEKFGGYVSQNYSPQIPKHN